MVNTILFIVDIILQCLLLILFIVFLIREIKNYTDEN